MHSSILLILHYMCYCKLYVTYLLYTAHHSHIAIALFLYSICCYHQMCIWYIVSQQRLRAAPSLDLV